MKQKILMSACCTGVKCKYSGGDSLYTEYQELKKQYEIVEFCPETCCGLSVPRPPAEIVGGDGNDVLNKKARVIDKSGKDLTEIFIQGAVKALETCKKHGITKAYLCKRSPSCGSGVIYDGSFSGRTIIGDGVTAALLKQNGIEVISI